MFILPEERGSKSLWRFNKSCLDSHCRLTLITIKAVSETGMSAFIVDNLC